MFNATKPFKDTVTNYPKEPSLRIGRRVPNNAVNLAYYYNPTATDAEKVLTAEAPRNTIDHRVEEAYRYLFDQASDDDDLFPGSVYFEDEEGYQGRLGRMYVNWYPEAHIEVKNVQQTKDIIVVEKSEVPKMFEYSDEDDYHSNLYLDAADYEVTKTKDATITEVLDREVFNHELSFNVIFGSYVNPGDLDKWMNPPTATTDTLWPKSITIGELKCLASGGTNAVQNYVNNTLNPYDDAVGVLQFDELEYEQVYASPASDSKEEQYTITGIFKSDEFAYTGDTDDESDMTAIQEYIATCKASAETYFLDSYNAVYDSTQDKYLYDVIDDFLDMASARHANPGAQFYTRINNAMSQNKDITVYLDQLTMKMADKSDPKSKFWFEAKYAYKIRDRGAEGGYKYNVIAKYKGVLKKTIITVKEVPAEYKATCNYVGIARKVWFDYDGVAYYRGAVTKGNGVGNVNPDGNNEILMFSDDEGYLRRPTEITDENGITSIKNFYRVEADYIYLTDVFKDGKACFYKYPLKRDIYDYRGPDDNGFYEGNAVKLCTAAFRDVPVGYVHNMKLKVSETEIVDDITDDFHVVSKEVPKRYSAELYTSFVSSSTDTFKVTYNAFNDSDTDNVAIDNGTTEDIYNYPFMHKGIDFFMDSVDVRARVNKIRLPEPRVIKDTRRYVSFSYTITAERKSDGAKYTTSPKTASILNRDFVVPAEYNKFDERAMIISPKSDGILLSPFDLVLQDQAASKVPTVITSKDKDFVFYATITEISDESRGAVNIKVNPDGSGYITAETTVNTGFFDERTGDYTKKLCLDSPYWLENGNIYPGFKVKCVDSRYIKVNAPRNDGLLESWYPMIQFGHYSQILDQYGTHIKVCYTMPEYDEQYYSPVHGKPYVDVVAEKVAILNSHMIKTACYPLHIKTAIPETIRLYKKVDDEEFDIAIRDVSFSDGIIVTKDTISENDNILCDYTYVEENFIYRGFWRNADDFARIDLNPNMYHTYSDLNYIPSMTKPSKNLFNKVIYFFMRPTVEYEVDAENDSLIYDVENDEDIGRVILENKDTLYHQIDNAQPESDHDIYIGSVYIRQNTSLHSTILVDSRTRGGGVLQSMSDSLRKELEPESDYYLDIGYYDGEPYQENGVIIIRLDNSLLKEFGGRFTQGDIEAKVKRWLGFGVYPIIEYVDSYSKRDMPQYNLEVEDSYTNVTDETPEILLECVSI